MSEADILGGHFAATRERMASTQDAPVLMWHDTTESPIRVEIFEIAIHVRISVELTICSGNR